MTERERIIIWKDLFSAKYSFVPLTVEKVVFGWSIWILAIKILAVVWDLDDYMNMLFVAASMFAL